MVRPPAYIALLVILATHLHRHHLYARLVTTALGGLRIVLLVTQDISVLLGRLIRLPLDQNVQSERTVTLHRR